MSFFDKKLVYIHITHQRIWFLRTKLFPLYSLIILFRSIWKFSDNLLLLKEISESNKKILSILSKNMKTMYFSIGEDADCARTRQYKKKKNNKKEKK